MFGEHWALALDQRSGLVTHELSSAAMTFKMQALAALTPEASVDPVETFRSIGCSRQLKVRPIDREYLPRR